MKDVDTQDGKPLVRFQDGNRLLYEHVNKTVTVSPITPEGRFTGESETIAMEDDSYGRWKKDQVLGKTSFLPGSETDGVLEVMDYNNPGKLRTGYTFTIDIENFKLTEFDLEGRKTGELNLDPVTNAPVKYRMFYPESQRQMSEYTFSNALMNGEVVTMSDEEDQNVKARTQFENNVMLRSTSNLPDGPVTSVLDYKKWQYVRASDNDPKVTTPQLVIS